MRFPKIRAIRFTFEVLGENEFVFVNAAVENQHLVHQIVEVGRALDLLC